MTSNHQHIHMVDFIASLTFLPCLDTFLEIYAVGLCLSVFVQFIALVAQKYGVSDNLRQASNHLVFVTTNHTSLFRSLPAPVDHGAVGESPCGSQGDDHGPHRRCARRRQYIRRVFCPEPEFRTSLYSIIVA